MVTDAFIVAFRLPNMFRRILGEGSLASSFVPLYVGLLNSDRTQRELSNIDIHAREFLNAVFSMLSVLTSILSVCGIVFMDSIIRWLVNGQSYMGVEGKYDLTVFFARIMFGYVFLVTNYAFLTSVANAHRKFFIPALAPAGFNLVIVMMTLVPQLRFSGDQMAWGILIGGAVQLAMAAIPLWKLKIFPRWTINWNVVNVSLFFRNLIPSIAGAGIAQLTSILNLHFASHLAQGSLSYIYFADRLVEFPQSLIAVSLGVALLPTLSELHSLNRRADFLITFQKHIRFLLMISIPAAVGLWVLSEPIVRAIFGRGNFIQSDISTTAEIVKVYSIILIMTGLRRVTAPCFYAVKNTWVPAVSSIICFFVHYFVASWATENFGLMGLVTATAITGALNLCLLLSSFKVIFKELGFHTYVRSVLWLLPAVTLMGYVAHYSYLGSVAILNNIYFLKDDRLGLNNIVSLALAITLSVVVYFVTNFLFKHPEVNELRKKLIFRRASSSIF